MNSVCDSGRPFFTLGLGVSTFYVTVWAWCCPRAAHQLPMKREER